MNCKFCENGKAIKSHIIPEWVYKHCVGYDEKHTILQLNSEEISKINTGFKEPLLCEKCDGYFNTHFDQPMFKFWNNTIKNFKVNDWEQKEMIVDYRMFKLFHLSILWRWDISKLAKNGMLGDKHRKRIKQMLVDRNPGPDYQYIIMGTSLNYKGQLFQALHFNQYKQPIKVDGHHYYIFAFCGFKWHYIISSHTTRNDLMDVRLKENNTITILGQNIHQDQTLMDIFQKHAIS